MAPALLTAVDSTSHIHLVVGSNALAAARCGRSIEVGAKPIIVAPEPESVHHGLAKRVEEHCIPWLKRDFHDADLTTLGRKETDSIVDSVFVTSDGNSNLAAHISRICRRLRVPVNVADAPSLCTFTLLSTHTSGPLQVGVTTSGNGCKLASRIRREVAAALPPDLGSAVERLGALRRRIYEHDLTADSAAEVGVEDDETGQDATFNKLVNPYDAQAAKARRMRWLSQVCEYWPLQRLATITDEDADALLRAYEHNPIVAASADNSPPLLASLSDTAHRTGSIILAGAGPGHPDLLTVASVKALRTADLILADKLVPTTVLDLVPRRTPVQIARKFPGNADAAQEELHALALDALKKGKRVLRLKQGDPYLYGRGAEEVALFRSHGYEPSVIPGITSALSAPLFANIPATHRGVSDQIVICTGTGRSGAMPDPPAYAPNQTVVFLMALHRLATLVTALTARDNGAYPPHTPCAVVERASCPDQRVIRTSLELVVEAVEEAGSRPPGLLVVGAACEVLQRYEGRGWTTEEGYRGLDGLEDFVIEVGKGSEGLSNHEEDENFSLQVAD